MLGNDVVDLLDVDARPETFRRRFDERVFAEEERRAIAAAASARSASLPASTPASPHPHALRWAHWGAKEAAYKLIRQADPSFVFSPRRLVARFEPSPMSVPMLERRGRLEVASGASPLAPAISLRSFETGDFVHVVALPADAAWSAVVIAVEAVEPLETVEPLGPVGAPRPVAASGAARVARAGLASEAVRRLASKILARELDVDAVRLAIGRRGRIPTVELDGRTLPIALSFSHHGRFVAFAATPRGAASLRAAAERTEQGRPSEPIDAKAFAAAGDRREFSRVRIASVRRASGEGMGPFASADTAWMVG